MPKVVLDFQLGTIYMVNQQLTHRVRLTQIYMLNIAVEVEDGLQIKIWDQISLYLWGDCMPKVVLDFQFGDDIHGEYVRIWAKSVLKPRFYHKMLSFFNRVLANGRKNIWRRSPVGYSAPHGAASFFLFFSTIYQNPIKKTQHFVGGRYMIWSYVYIGSLPLSGEAPEKHTVQSKQGARASLRVTPGLKGRTKKDERAGWGEGSESQIKKSADPSNPGKK